MGRMIYSRVVIDMASGEVLEAKGKMYEGPLSFCGGGSGGGSSTTNTVDYGYNWRMATLSEEQQDWAREYFGVWQDYQKPYEIAQMQANLEMLPLESSVYKNQLTTANDLLPLEANYTKAQLEAANKTLPLQTGLYTNQLNAANELLPLEKEYAKGQLEAANAAMPKQNALYNQTLDAASGLLPQQTKAAGQFLTAALNGVDVNERMGLAAADTANAFKDAKETTARANARMGVNPNSGRLQGIMAALDTQQAAQMAGARTQARVGAEQENFNRLAKAASFNAANSYLQAAQTLKPSATNLSNSILQGSQVVSPNVKNASNDILQGLNYVKG